MKIRFAAFGSKKPSDGTIWSFNIARICDTRIALKSASGSTIYPENGIPIRFDSSAPAVRLLSSERTMQSKAGLGIEVASGQGGGGVRLLRRKDAPEGHDGGRGRR